MIAAVLLAGGEARRLGQPKGLVHVGAERLLERQLRALDACGVVDVAVSLGPNRARYIDVWPDMADDVVRRGGLAVRVVSDARSRHGPFGSLVAGIAALLALSWQRLLVAPIDVPIAPLVVRALAAVSAEAVVPRFDGRGGHPVLLRRSLAESLVKREVVATRLDQVLRGLAPQARVDVDVEEPLVVVDINTLGDVEKV